MGGQGVSHPLSEAHHAFIITTEKTIIDYKLYHLLAVMWNLTDKSRVGM
jgi:hypothetical protein